MTTTFPYRILTPSSQLASGEAAYVQVPGVAGSFGVLPGHAPLVSLLANEAQLTVRDAEGAEQVFTITGGVAEITAEGLTILAESAQAAA